MRVGDNPNEEGTDLEKERKVAFQAALEAGALLKERLGSLSSVDYKGAFNLVTDVDKASEKLILDIIQSEFPEDSILAEESGKKPGELKRRWLIDPLDGTTNYAHTYPFFSVSIGLEIEGEIALGAVYNPMNDELFWAVKGGGAWLNDERIAVSTTSSLVESLLATGFPPELREAKVKALHEFTNMTSICHGVRRDGSAALDLCFVASGRLDGFWEMKLSPWDVAAGSLIVTEAGGMVSNLEGGKLNVDRGDILATNGKIHKEVFKSLLELSTSI
ncbi:MAG: inositol monophosphatase [Cyanobacteria bacterium]|nr:inositol monophosphatase [Cyanobacteriota bacterium]